MKYVQIVTTIIRNRHRQFLCLHPSAEPDLDPGTLTPATFVATVLAERVDEGEGENQQENEGKLLETAE